MQEKIEMRQIDLINIKNLGVNANAEITGIIRKSQTISINERKSTLSFLAQNFNKDTEDMHALKEDNKVNKIKI